MKFTVYTDGSYRRSSDTGGYAAYVVDTGDLIHGSAVYTTNNRMEIMAVLAILDALPSGCQVTIYSDSAYVVNSISKGWIYKWASNNWNLKKGQVKNVDLWMRILQHLSRLTVNMIWVRSHDGNPYNELCDEIAGYESSKK